jgi:hypothetical protein
MEKGRHIEIENNADLRASWTERFQAISSKFGRGVHTATIRS